MENASTRVSTNKRRLVYQLRITRGRLESERGVGDGFLPGMAVIGLKNNWTRGVYAKGVAGCKARH